MSLNFLKRHTYVYDDQGRLVRYIPPEGPAEVYDYECEESAAAGSAEGVLPFKALDAEYSHVTLNTLDGSPLAECYPVENSQPEVGSPQTDLYTCQSGQTHGLDGPDHRDLPAVRGQDRALRLDR